MNFRIGGAVQALGEYRSGDGQIISLNASVWQGWLNNYHDFISRERVHEVLEALILAIQKGNDAVTTQLAPFLTNRHPSQLYQAVLEGLLVFYFVDVGLADAAKTRGWSVAGTGSAIQWLALSGNSSHARRADRLSAFWPDARAVVKHRVFDFFDWVFSDFVSSARPQVRGLAQA